MSFAVRIQNTSLVPCLGAGSGPATIAGTLVAPDPLPQGATLYLSNADLATWVERELPPRGTPHGYDAAVWDWARDGDAYLGEPETAATWPAYRSRAPGSRPTLASKYLK